MDLHSIAHEMMTAQSEVRQIAPFTSRLAVFDDEAAYHVSRLIHDRRVKEGFVPIGRKIGFTNPDMWELYGVREPIWAHIYDRTVVMSSGSPVRCPLGPFTEPEIIVHFRSTPLPTSDLNAILECVDWFAHGMEIVQSHFPGWSFRAPDAIADCALHGTLLVGEPQDVGMLGDNLLRDQETFTVALSCDGVCRERGRGSNVLGSPLAAISHLLAVIAEQSYARTIEAGEMVTTGTLTTALPVHAGQIWQTEVEGVALPGMTVAFER